MASRMISNIYQMKNSNLKITKKSKRKLKTCDYLKNEFSLTNNEKLQLFQIVHALPKQWREIVATYDGNLSNVFLPENNLI